MALAEASREVTHNQVINIGSNDENFQVRQVVDIVKELMPNSTVNYTGQVVDDPRSYRVNFDLLKRLLPDFELSFDLRRGMYKLAKDFKDCEFIVRGKNIEWTTITYFSEILNEWNNTPNITIDFNINIDKGFHIYSVHPDKSLSPTYTEINDSLYFNCF